MAFIRQRGKKDCGVAALAMLCDVTYEEAEKAIPWRREGLLHGTTTKQLRDGAIKLGYSTESTPQHRLKIIKVPLWTLIPDNSLVKIPIKSMQNAWHWVVWRKGKIYDPARGVFTPYKYNVQPLSYMKFTEEIDDV